jgi:hypothetical protein
LLLLLFRFLLFPVDAVILSATVFVVAVEDVVEVVDALWSWEKGMERLRVTTGGGCRVVCVERDAGLEEEEEKEGPPAVDDDDSSSDPVALRAVPLLVAADPDRVNRGGAGHSSDEDRCRCKERLLPSSDTRNKEERSIISNFSIMTSLSLGALIS